MNPEFFSMSFLVIAEHLRRERRGLGTVWPITMRAWLHHAQRENNQ